MLGRRRVVVAKDDGKSMDGGLESEVTSWTTERLRPRVGSGVHARLRPDFGLCGETHNGTAPLPAHR
jgi:hypothetical protein